MVYFDWLVMIMKKNILIYFLISAMIICGISNTVFAGNFIPNNVNPELNIKGGENIKTMASKIIGTLMWVGYILAIGMIVFIGIKYILASADERASMKGMLVKVVVGSLIIVGSVTIVNAVMTILNAPS